MAETYFRSTFTYALLTAALLLTISACAPKTTAPHEYVTKKDAQTQAAGTNSIIVTDANGVAIAGAKVMIGNRANVPFVDNVLTADSNGAIPLPTDWTTVEPVTIEAAGYVRTTWMEQAPGAVVFSMRAIPPTQKLVLTGKTKGYPNLSKDGWADVGIVFPALKYSQLASLQPSDLISPEVDTISIFGQTIDIPTNVSVPKQDERYYFTVTLEKPIYSISLNDARTWKIASTHTRFPFEDVADELRAGKTFFDVINYFEFKGASLTDLAISKPKTTKDLSINDIKFDGRIDVSAPKFASKYSMLAVSVIESGGMLYPTDVKKLSSNETRRLVMPKAAPGYLVGALRDAAAPTHGPACDQFSAVIASNATTTRFEFLELPSPPKHRAGLLTLYPPKAAVGMISPMATYATMNKVVVVTSGSISMDVKTPFWDIYAPGWASSIDLPDMPAPPKGKYRWEATFGGAPAGTTTELGPHFVESLSHIAKSAVDL